MLLSESPPGEVSRLCETETQLVGCVGATLWFPLQQSRAGRPQTLPRVSSGSQTSPEGPPGSQTSPRGSLPAPRPPRGSVLSPQTSYCSPGVHSAVQMAVSQSETTASPFGTFSLPFEKVSLFRTMVSQCEMTASLFETACPLPVWDASITVWDIFFAV